MIEQHFSLKSSQCYDFSRTPFTEGYPVYSRCFVCPKCITVWGVLLNIGGLGIVSRAEVVSCEQCDWRDGVDVEIPGSILYYSIPVSGVDWQLLEALPEPLLRREFDLTLKALA